jgi:glutaredoxin
MTRICPKCNYARQATDNAPEWQCPSCQVAYNKVGATAPTVIHSQSAASASYGDAPRFPALKWIFLAASIGIGIWVAKPFEKPSNANLVAAAPSSKPAVTLYSTEWCGYCDAARKFFKQNDIQYIEMDIEKTTAGYEEHKSLGGKGVPLLVIGDEVIHGYSEQTMRHTLKPWLKGS